MSDNNMVEILTKMSKVSTTKNHQYYKNSHSKNSNEKSIPNTLKKALLILNHLKFNLKPGNFN